MFIWNGCLPAPQQPDHALRTHSTALQDHWLCFVNGYGRSETSPGCSKVWLPHPLLKQVLSTEDSPVPVAAAIKCLVTVKYLSSQPLFFVCVFAMVSEDHRLNVGCKAGLLVTYLYLYVCNICLQAALRSEV